MEKLFRKRSYVSPGIKCFLIPVLLIFTYSSVLSQNIKSNAVPYWNYELSKIAYPPEAPGWYKFRPNTINDATKFFTIYKKTFGLREDDEMRLIRSDKDPNNATHYRFQQYYKGIKIEGAEYLLHEKSGYVNSANGKMVYNLQASLTPAIDEASALTKALRSVPSARYKLSDSDSRVFNNITYHPKGELVFQKKNTDLPFTPENFRLCYHYNIYKETSDGFSVYIDAKTGELVNKIPLQSNCDATTVTTNWYGSKTIYTEYSNPVFGSPHYLLEDDCTSTDIEVHDAENSTATSGSVYSQSTNTNWSASSELKSASTSLWCCKRTVSFYSSVFNRNGYNNNGGNVDIYQNAGFELPNGSIYYANASMSATGGNLRVGNNGTTTNTDDWNTLDIIGHEFTHAVTGATSGLEYQGESGALNESFSDIMGTYVEYWDGSSSFDWNIGEDRGSKLRNMQNPNEKNNPDTYGGTFWVTGASDNGGVHTNSGVQNFWFYLLSNGGSGTNDNGDDYDVNGIGIAAAGFIAYMTDAYYLTSSAQYIDARSASIEVANDYYGNCSNAAIAVGDAWHAVGVESQSPEFVNNVCGVYPVSGTSFQAISILTASAGDCTASILPSSSTVTFKARDAVILYPGFTAFEGSNFIAYLSPCSSTMLRTASPQSVMSNTEKETKNTSSKQTESPKGATGLIESVTVAPNPFSATFIVSINSKQNTKAQVIIYNATGVKVKEQTGISISTGLNKLPFNCSNLPQGIYMLELYLGSTRTIKKIVKL